MLKIDRGIKCLVAWDNQGWNFFKWSELRSVIKKRWLHKKILRVHWIKQVCLHGSSVLQRWSSIFYWGYLTWY